MHLNRSTVLAVLSAVLFLGAIYCFLGVVMNGSFAVANSEHATQFQRAADLFFYLSVALLASSVVSAIAAWRSRRSRHRKNDERSEPDDSRVTGPAEQAGPRASGRSADPDSAS